MPLVVDRARLPEDWPTNRGSSAVWEELGRTVATFSHLEDMMARAWFGLTATREFEDMGQAEAAFPRWEKALKESLTDSLRSLTDKLKKAFKDDDRVPRRGRRRLPRPPGRGPGLAQCAVSRRVAGIPGRRLRRSPLLQARRRGTRAPGRSPERRNPVFDSRRGRRPHGRPRGHPVRCRRPFSRHRTAGRARHRLLEERSGLAPAPAARNETQVPTTPDCPHPRRRSLRASHRPATGSPLQRASGCRQRPRRPPRSSDSGSPRTSITIIRRIPSFRRRSPSDSATSDAAPVPGSSLARSSPVVSRTPVRSNSRSVSPFRSSIVVRSIPNRRVAPPSRRQRPRAHAVGLPHTARTASLARS